MRRRNCHASSFSAASSLLVLPASVVPVKARACPGNSTELRFASAARDDTWVSVSPVDASLGNTVRALKCCRPDSTAKLQASGWKLACRAAEMAGAQDCSICTVCLLLCPGIAGFTDNYTSPAAVAPLLCLHNPCVTPELWKTLHKVTAMSLPSSCSAIACCLDRFPLLPAASAAYQPLMHMHLLLLSWCLRG